MSHVCVCMLCSCVCMSCVMCRVSGYATVWPRKSSVPRFHRYVCLDVAKLVHMDVIACMCACVCRMCVSHVYVSVYRPYHLCCPTLLAVPTVYAPVLGYTTTVSHITSRHITSHHITSHHITSQHITSHRIISHDITAHHITSHHITSHMTHTRVTSTPSVRGETRADTDM